jgi:hypothetical protein
MKPTTVSSKPTPATALPTDPLHNLVPGYLKLAGKMGIMRRTASCKTAKCGRKSLRCVPDVCSQGIHRGERKPCLRVAEAALIRQATILKMKEPDVFDLHHIQKFMASGDMSLLLGPDHNT